MTISDTITAATEALAKATAAIISGDADGRAEALARSFVDFQDCLADSVSASKQSIISKAALALGESVGLILDSDESEEDKRKALGETFAECEVYLKREFGFAEVTKAGDRRGHNQLAGALVEHLHDALERHRERHGYQRKESNMSTNETLDGILKDFGPVKICKHI